MAFSDIIAQAQERISAQRMYVDDSTDKDVRTIIALLDLLDPDSPKVKADLDFLDDLRGRRARASLAAGGREPGRAAAAESTTQEDVDRLSHMASERGSFIVGLVDARSCVWDDFRAGHRCMVCGMTKAQAAAANYDCTEEC